MQETWIRDAGLTPGWGRSPTVGNSNPLQYSCLENSMHRRVWWAKVHGVTKSQTQLSDWKHTYTHTFYVINSLYITHLVGYSPWGRKESDTTEQLHFHFSHSHLEKEMATHSRVLAWRIPGTVEPGGLPSMGLHRVRHDWSDLAAAAATTMRSSGNLELECHALTFPTYKLEERLNDVLWICYWCYEED